MFFLTCIEIRYYNVLRILMHLKKRNLDGVTSLVKTITLQQPGRRFLEAFAQSQWLM